MRPTELKKDNTLYWVIMTYDANGVLVDADSTPTVAVRKNGASTADSVTVTKRSATTGIYDCSYSPSGEVAGDQYTLEETATVSSQAYVNSFSVAVTSQESDVISLNGDATAAANISLQYDGVTGLTGDVFPATQASVSNIGSVGSGAVNFVAVEDNSASPIKGVSSVGTTSDAYTNAEVEDGVVQTILDVANNIDWVYGFDLGGGNSGVGVEVFANVNGNADAMDVFAYNFDLSSWDQIGILDGSGGAAFRRLNLTLLARHTGSGADLGKVYIRFDGANYTPSTFELDKINVSAVNTSKTIGYDNASVWVDTISGTAGSEPFVNGVADNPTLSYASANAIAAAIGLKRYTFSAGDSITLTQSHLLDSFFGYNYTLNMNGQVAPNFIEGAEIAGVTANTGPHYVRDSRIGTLSTAYELNAGAVFVSSGLVSVKLKDAAAAALDVEFLDCHGNTQGSMFPGGTVDFGTTAGTNHEVSFQRWGGPVAIVNLKDGDTVYAHGNGTFILDASCTGGSFRVAGMINLVDNSGGLVSILEDGRITKSGIAAQVWDTDQADHTNPGTFGLYLDSEVSLAGDDSATIYSYFTSGSNEDAFKADVSGLATSASTSAISADLAIVDSNVDAVKVKTDQLAFTVAGQVDANALTGGGGDDAATIYSYFVSGSNEDAFKADISGLATSSALAIVDANVDSILVDTSSSIPASLSTLATAADLAIVDGNVDSILVDTSVSIPLTLSGLATSASVSALNDFDPAVDTVARVTLVDTTTDLTNGGGGGCPTVAEITDGIWDELQGDHTTPGTFGAYLDSQVSTAGSGGTGLYQAVVRVEDASGDAISGARINIDGTTLTQTTPTSGEITFNLDSGIYTLDVSPPSGYDTPTSIILTVSTSDPAQTTFVLTETTPPGSCDPIWIG